MNKRERDYFVSTCLKAGSVASWVFFPSSPPYLHSLFRDTLGPVWIGCLLRRRAKHFSPVRWHCHLGGTRRPSRSQDLTGPPHSLFILLSPSLPFLLPMLSSLGQPGSTVAVLVLVFPNEGIPMQRREWKVYQPAWGTHPQTDFPTRIWGT